MPRPRGSAPALPALRRDRLAGAQLDQPFEQLVDLLLPAQVVARGGRPRAAHADADYGRPGREGAVGRVVHDGRERSVEVEGEERVGARESLQLGRSEQRFHQAVPSRRAPPSRRWVSRSRCLSLAASASMRPAQRYTLNSDTRLRSARIRSACSSAGITSAAARAELASSRSYGFTISASVSSRAAPVNWLSTSTPRSSSRAATNSFATRFIPSWRLLT